MLIEDLQQFLLVDVIIAMYVYDHKVWLLSMIVVNFNLSLNGWDIEPLNVFYFPEILGAYSIETQFTASDKYS